MVRLVENAGVIYQVDLEADALRERRREERRVRRHERGQVGVLRGELGRPRVLEKAGDDPVETVDLLAHEGDEAGVLGGPLARHVLPPETLHPDGDRVERIAHLVRDPLGESAVGRELLRPAALPPEPLR